MKAKFKQIGLGDARHMLVVSTDQQYTYGIALDNGTSVTIPSNQCQFYEIEQAQVDWEQRRYEVAKAAMQGMLSNSLFQKYSAEGYHRGNIIHNALSYADKLIEQLNKQHNNNEKI